MKKLSKYITAEEFFETSGYKELDEGRRDMLESAGRLLGLPKGTIPTRDQMAKLIKDAEFNIYLGCILKPAGKNLDGYEVWEIVPVN